MVQCCSGRVIPSVGEFPPRFANCIVAGVYLCGSLLSGVLRIPVTRVISSILHFV